MKTAPVAEVQAKFSSYMKAAEKEPILVTRDGRPVGLLVGLTDEEECENLLLAHSPMFQAILEGARKRMNEGEGIPADAFWEELARERQAEKGKKEQRTKRPPRAKKTTRGG